MRKTILLDCDGVLSDFTSGFLKVANKIAETNYTHKDVKTWDLTALPGLKEAAKKVWKEVGAPGFAQTLDVYPGAIEGYKKLCELGDVYIVTSPLFMHKDDPDRHPNHGATFCFDRAVWLETHFGVDPKKILFAYNKHIVEGDVLIDDKIENIRDWMEMHGSKRGTRAVLWAQLYNVDGDGNHPKVLRTDSWSEAAKFITRLK